MIVAALGLLCVSCGGPSVEERAREAAEEIQKSMGNADAAALGQDVAPAVVKEVQTHLATINEYQGEINGELDSVTINAIQAFQRQVTQENTPWWAPWRRLEDDGMINERTRKMLAAAAAAQGG